MGNTRFHNFYGINVSTDINKPDVFFKTIETYISGNNKNLRYLILNPYCYYYLRPMFQEYPFNMEREQHSILVSAGVVGTLKEPQLKVVLSEALPHQLLFFTTYEPAKSLTNQFAQDKFIMALMFHITSHIDTVYDLIALRAELKNLT